MLFEKGHNEKMVREQVLRAREHSREGLLEKVKSESNQTESNQSNQTDIQYYLLSLCGFSKCKKHFTRDILLTPDQEHKKFLQDIPVVGFR